MKTLFSIITLCYSIILLCGTVRAQEYGEIPNYLIAENANVALVVQMGNGMSTSQVPKEESYKFLVNNLTKDLKEFGIKITKDFDLLDQQELEKYGQTMALEMKKANIYYMLMIVVNSYPASKRVEKGKATLVDYRSIIFYPMKFTGASPLAINYTLEKLWTVIGTNYTTLISTIKKGISKKGANYFLKTVEQRDINVQTDFYKFPEDMKTSVLLVEKLMPQMPGAKAYNASLAEEMKEYPFEYKIIENGKTLELKDEGYKYLLYPAFRNIKVTKWKDQIIGTRKTGFKIKEENTKTILSSVVIDIRNGNNYYGGNPSNGMTLKGALKKNLKQIKKEFGVE